MAKMKAVVMVGISGSGKSTKARAEYPGYEIVERDAIRRAMLKEKKETAHVDEVNMWSLWKFNKTNEEAVTKAFDIRLAACAAGKRNVVVADTNVSVKTRTSVTMKLKSLGYDVEIVDVECDLLTAFKRDERRRDTVGRDVIYDQYLKYLAFKGRKQYKANEELTPCILVDIDGTLAHMNGKRGAFEWDKVGLDDIDYCVREFVNGWKLANPHGKVVVLSGRDGICQGDTFKWLNDRGVNFDALIMRTAGDMRKDSIVKEEIFWNYIAEVYNVKFVLDDRPQVCRMWRELGLKVFQVGDPHVEF